MVEGSEMSREVGLIAGALTRYATEQGWNDSEYWIYYWENPDWDKVHFVFVSSHFNDQDSNEITKQVWAFLESELKSAPEVLRSLGLVVRSKKKVDEGGLYAIGPSYREFWTFYPARAH